MLTLITATDLDLTVEDPVRPTIPMLWRQQYEIWAWMENGERAATVCVAWLDAVPDSEASMLIMPRGFKAVAYTIWSAAPGAGKKLILALQDQIKENPLCEGMYTLSPTTEMARKFHINNGARVYRINESTINYQYKHDRTAEPTAQEREAQRSKNL
jgi:hypothetical protein